MGRHDLRPQQRRRVGIVRAGAAAAIASIALVFVGSQPAAAEPVKVSVEFRDATAQSVEYGEMWDAAVVVGPLVGCYYKCNGLVTIYDNGEFFGSYELLLSATDESYVSLGNWSQPDGVGTGSHVFTAALESRPDFSPEPYVGSTSTSLDVTISPAPLAADLRVETDPVNSSNAIITARLTGAFVDRLEPFVGERTPNLPSGTWNVSLTDGDGTEVWRQEATVEAGGMPYLTWYWQAAPRDATFAGSAVFTPTGDSATEFASSPAAISYTSPPAPSTPANGEPAVEDPVTAPVVETLPLWAIILGALIAAASLLVIVLALVRRPRSHPESNRELVPPTDSESRTTETEVEHV